MVVAQISLPASQTFASAGPPMSAAPARITAPARRMDRMSRALLDVGSAGRERWMAARAPAGGWVSLGPFGRARNETARPPHAVEGHPLALLGPRPHTDTHEVLPAQIASKPAIIARDHGDVRHVGIRHALDHRVEIFVGMRDDEAAGRDQLAERGAAMPA